MCAFIKPIFDRFVAPDYSQEGVNAFYCFANGDAMARRLASGSFVWVTLKNEELAGMIEFQRPDHIAMLFVGLRGQGIARTLLSRAIGLARQEHPDSCRITVHSSPYAEPVYRKLGFIEAGERTTRNGITYLPMELKIP